MKIQRGKSRAARRTLKLAPESREILFRRISGSDGWIFAGKRPGTHCTKLNNPHQRVLDRTGLRFVLYDLRHTFATRAAEGGMPVATLAAILGHGDLRSVMKYVHVRQEAMDRAMEAAFRVKIGSTDGAETGDFGVSGSMGSEDLNARKIN